MNYEEIDSATGCEELLSEVPQMFGNFMVELEDVFKSNSLKHTSELKVMKNQLEKMQDQHIQTTSEKQRLKLNALAIEKQNDNDSSYFIYSEKEIQDELDYQKKVISWAKRKICLYELLTRVEWNPEYCKGKLVASGKEFDLSDLEVYEQVNTLWGLI